MEIEVTLSSLWLPILLSGVFCFVASSIIHMVLQLHNKDYGPLPDEEPVREALRGQKITPGLYTFPHCHSFKEMAASGHMEKLNRGPNGFLTILPDGPPAMGKYLIQWFFYLLLASVFIGYLTSLAVDSEASIKSIVQAAGTASMLAYCLPAVMDSIWKSIPWTVSCKFIFDGLIFSAVTAATFVWLWPQG